MVWFQIRTKIATNKERVKFSTKIPKNFNPLTKLSRRGLKHICISKTPVHISIYVFVSLARLYLKHSSTVGRDDVTFYSKLCMIRPSLKPKKNLCPCLTDTLKMSPTQNILWPSFYQISEKKTYLPTWKIMSR